jgi:hypothetical protein
MANDTRYPVTLDVDYPDRKLNRLSSFFRFVTIIPAAIILAFVSGTENGPFLFLPTLLMILIRRKYPRWWFDWNLNMARFSARVAAYAALLTDEYPSTEREQSVHVVIPYPDVRKDLLPGLPLVKWFLAIPHAVILVFLGIAAAVCVLVAWLAILFTGRYPRPLFDFVVGTGRWGLRVSAYAILLVTDVYPPFSLR